MFPVVTTLTLALHTAVSSRVCLRHISSSKTPSTHQQPTIIIKKPNNGARHRSLLGYTKSFAEMVKKCLKTLKEVGGGWSWRKTSTFQTEGHCYWWDIIPSDNWSFVRIILVGCLSGIWTQKCRRRFGWWPLRFLGGGAFTLRLSVTTYE